ncbi:MAG: hypothetical protein ABGX83_02545 [Nitrospira sp.]|nr:hypothetical protein [Candidatus Manganitrophaceae bacterium]HIL34150.1 hypothetical protein [Candidatus Manganitrophaceae bacterium]
MKKVGSVIVALIIIFSFATPQIADARHKKKGKTKGEIVKIEGKLVKGQEGTVTLKDKKGKLHTFQFDATTELKGRMGANTGVKIAIVSEEGGHAKSIVDKLKFEEVFMPDFLFLTPPPPKDKAK